MNQIEIWKDVVGYEGIYQISNLGRVKSLSRKSKHSKGGNRDVKERILNASISKRGYLVVNLSKDGKAKIRTVHQLVAIAFLNHYPNGSELVVDHKNAIKTDNRLGNLQLITTRYNTSKDRKGGASKYVGVSWNKPTNKWMAQIQINGIVKHLGRFVNEIDAHHAYQNALKSVI